MKRQLKNKKSLKFNFLLDIPSQHTILVIDQEQNVLALEYGPIE